MKHFMMSVRDSAVGSFMRPFTAPSVPAAVRSFGDEVNRAGSEMNQHPGDYELYQVGYFDEETGRFDAEFPVTMVVRAKDLVKGGGDVQK